MNCSITYSGRFTPDKALMYRRCTYWFRYLLRTAMSLWEYEGLPDSVNRDAMVMSLLTKGYAVAQKVPTNKLLFWKKDIYIVDAAVSGVDPYGFPRWSQLNNPFLGAKKGVLHDDAVLIRANRLAEPATDIINQYAELLAQCDIGIVNNLTALNSTRIFKAENDKEAQAYRLMMDLASSGEPAVLLRNNILDDESNSFMMLNGNVQYLVHDYIKDMIALISQFLGNFGVEALPMEKGGNIITPEIKINMRYSEITKSYWIEPQTESFDEMNRIFGTQIKVKLREPDITQLAKLDANGNGSLEPKEVREAVKKANEEGESDGTND